ncbi:hypothetical protein [Noviherbaspirillum soli]|uniref:hypothetical protein n=1 Tax=Noviherbaspirillum soli TaxID=1064518 RepID=UPI00188D44C7|nr:hypothetical protein [Noviherbaspirillum soli]
MANRAHHHPFLAQGGANHNAVTAITDLCAYIGEVRGSAACLEPAYIAARMLGVTGDMLGCVGGRFRRAVVAGAPRTSAQARHDHLIASLERGNGDQARIAGARKDLHALACAMRQPVVRGAQSQRQKIKIENVFVARAERCNLPAMDELLAQHPSLRGMRERSGRSGAQMYQRVLSAVTIVREMDILEAGQGGATNLHCLLESISSLCAQGERFRLNLDNVLRGQPRLLAEGLRWAAMHDEEPLFLHLMPAVDPAAKLALLKQCLALAMSSSPWLAIGILQMHDPNASPAKLISRGMKEGATEEVVFAWLSQLDWMADHHCAAEVLKGLRDNQLFPGLPVMLAKRSPMVFEALLALMRQDEQRYSSYVLDLLIHAQENRDASLLEKLARG